MDSPQLYDTSDDKNQIQMTSTFNLNLRKTIELCPQSKEEISTLDEHVAAAPLYQTTTRKRVLQRQRPTEILDDSDYAYAADMEEEEEEEEEDYDDEERFIASEEPDFGQIRKHLQFQKHKQKTESSLLINSSALISLPPSCLGSSLPNVSPLTHQSTVHGSLRRHLKHEESFDSTASATTDTTSPTSPATRRHHFSMLKRDNSTHSDSSRYSSVDSLLESRKPDPEAILINLGFGPVGSEDILSRIPKRFLKPSQVRGIDTDAFIKRLQLANNLADHSVLGYRGLTGNPDIPPSRIVAKIMQRFEVNERKKSMGSIEHSIQ